MRLQRDAVYLAVINNDDIVIAVYLASHRGTFSRDSDLQRDVHTIRVKRSHRQQHDRRRGLENIAGPSHITTLTGAVTVSTVRVAGTASMEWGFYADVVTIVGDNTGAYRTQNVSITSGNSSSFSVEIHVSQNATAVSFRIDMSGHYANEGVRFLVVKATFM